MTGRSRPWTTGLLLLTCTALGGVAAYGLTGGFPIAPEVTAAAAPTSKVGWDHEPVVFEPPDRSEFAEITERPLFSPGRRPYEGLGDAVIEAEMSAMAVPVELIGVVLTDRRRAALIQPIGSGDAAWVREGEQAQGWEIDKIEQDRVHLRSGEHVEVVELRPDTAVGADERWTAPPEEEPLDEAEEDQFLDDDDQLVVDEEESLEHE